MLRFLLLTSLATIALAEMRPEPRYVEEINERVMGGEDTEPKSWPWQISLQFQSGSNFYHTCGGTLIATGWVMTAAHCLNSSRRYRVVIGDHDVMTTSGREQIRSVSQVYIHRLWNPSSGSNEYNIALLKLSSDAILNTYVQLGALPPNGQILPQNNICYITGWGRTSTGGPLTVLQQAMLRVVGHEECAGSDWWGSIVKKTMVCAGGGAQSPCTGDSGGPLNCLVNGNYVVHGIAILLSGHGCNYPNKPSVFTRVSAHIDWMDSIMN